MAAAFVGVAQPHGSLFAPTRPSERSPWNELKGDASRVQIRFSENPKFRFGAPFLSKRRDRTWQSNGKRWDRDRGRFGAWIFGSLGQASDAGIDSDGNWDSSSGHEFAENSMISNNSSSLLGGFLSKVAQTYLTSQLDSFDSLRVHVKGDNLQLLKGNVSSIHISGFNVVYRGLSLTRVFLQSSTIQLQLTNPEKLLKDSFSVDANISISHNDMNKCLLSPLGTSAINNIIEVPSLSKIEFLDQVIKLSSITQTPHPSNSTLLPATNEKGDRYFHLSISSKGQTLYLKRLEGFNHLDKFIPENVHQMRGNSWKFDLGPNTCISSLRITKQGLFLRAKFTVIPNE